MTTFSKEKGILTTQDLDINAEDGFIIDDDDNFFLRKILDKHPIPFETFIGYSQHQIYWLTENNYLTKEVIEKYKSYLHRNYQQSLLYWWTGKFNQSAKIKLQAVEDEEIVPILFSVKILDQNGIFFTVRQNINNIYAFDIIVDESGITSKRLNYREDYNDSLSYFDIISF